MGQSLRKLDLGVGSSGKPGARCAHDISLREIEDAWGAFPAPELTRAKVNRLMTNRSNEPKRAIRLHVRLKSLMELAVNLGWISVNLAARQQPFKVKVKGIRARHEGTRRLCLLLYLGQRSIGTVGMARNHLDGDAAIPVAQEKTGTANWLPLHSGLKATLDAGPLGRLCLIETEFDRRRTVKGFYNWLKAAMRAAGCDEDLSPHGLRAAAATRLIDAGATGAQVCAITGHKSLKEMERYIRDRNQRVLALSAIRMLEQNKN